MWKDFLEDAEAISEIARIFFGTLAGLFVAALVAFVLFSFVGLVMHMAGCV